MQSASLRNEKTCNLITYHHSETRRSHTIFQTRYRSAGPLLDTVHATVLLEKVLLNRFFSLQSKLLHSNRTKSATERLHSQERVQQVCLYKSLQFWNCSRGLQQGRSRLQSQLITLTLICSRFQVYIKEHPPKDKAIPGPGTYNTLPVVGKEGAKYSLRPRTSSQCMSLFWRQIIQIWRVMCLHDI